MLNYLYFQYSVCIKPVTVSMGGACILSGYRNVLTFVAVDVMGKIHCAAHQPVCQHRYLDILELFYNRYIQNTVAAVSQRCYLGSVSPLVRIADGNHDSLEIHFLSINFNRVVLRLIVFP